MCKPRFSTFSPTHPSSSFHYSSHCSPAFPCRAPPAPFSPLPPSSHTERDPESRVFFLPLSTHPLQPPGTNFPGFPALGGPPQSAPTAQPEICSPSWAPTRPPPAQSAPMTFHFLQNPSLPQQALPSLGDSLSCLLCPFVPWWKDKDLATP